jgi:hypothetical protein
LECIIRGYGGIPVTTYSDEELFGKWPLGNESGKHKNNAVKL